MVADEAELNLMLMRSAKIQQIKRNGVYINMFGEKLWYMDTEQTISNLKKKVYVRYDPADLRSVRIYDEQDKYLYTWQLADMLLLDYLTDNKEELSDSQKYIRNVSKVIKNEVKEIGEGLSREQRITMLDMSIRKARQKREEQFEIKFPTNIIPIRANEPEQAEVRKVVGEAVEIDLTKMARNSLKRKEE